MTIRVGIVGTGGMAHSHAEGFSRIEGVTLASCFDVLPDRCRAFAEKHGIAHCAAEMDELLERVDAVTIVTPDNMHMAGAIQVLEAGKHLLCEKPLTVNLEQARKVVKAYQKATKEGVIGMVNFSYRRSAALQKAIDLVEDGALGEIRHAHGFYLQSWLSAPVWGHWTDDTWLWRLQTAAGSGGVLGDIGCHLLDLATSVTGPVTKVRCWLSTFPKLSPDGQPHHTWHGKKLDANDTAIIELMLPNGGTTLLHTTRWATGHTNHLRLEAHGTRGGLMFDLDRSYDRLDVCLDGDPAKASWRTLELRPAPTNYERFVRSIAEGSADQPDILRGAEVQAYLDACERSAESGQWETVLDYT